MKVFVTTYGRKTMLEQCLASLERFPDLEITVVDNELNGNEFRHLAPWGLDLVPTDEPYIVTDGDCAVTPECPDNFVEKMLWVLEKWPDVTKVGLGINTANFLDPPPERYKYSYEMERNVRNYPMRSFEVRDAPVDTTFAMYRGPEWPGIGGVRLDTPYLIEHLPWLNADYTDEEREYYARSDMTTWARTHSAASEVPPKVLVPFTALRAETIVALGDSDIPYEMVARPLTDDEGYFWALAEAWTPTAEHKVEPFILIEHDIVVRPETLRELRDCPEDWCGAPYPYLDREKAWGLGCVKFSDRLIAHNPWLFRQPWEGDDIHPARHWCRLDTYIWEGLTANGYTRHDHDGPVLGHLTDPTKSAHGCVRIT